MERQQIKLDFWQLVLALVVAQSIYDICTAIAQMLRL